MNLNTRLTYDESVINHPDVLDIIRKQEKIAVRYGLYNDVTVRIDPGDTVFYDIRLYIKTCKRNPETDAFGMYLTFQFVPSDKYFAMKMGENYLIDYAPNGTEFYDTSLCAILNIVNGIIPSWEHINDYFAAIRMITLREHYHYNPDKERN